MSPFPANLIGSSPPDFGRSRPLAKRTSAPRAARAEPLGGLPTPESGDIATGDAEIMKRRLNVRLVICIVVSIFLVGIGIGLLHRVRVKQKVAALLDQADRAESVGDTARAEENLRLFLGYRPDHPIAAAKYGLILASGAQSNDERIRALQVLEHALRLDPDRRDVRRRVVDLALGLGWYNVGQAHLKLLLGQRGPSTQSEGRDPTPEDGELEYLSGLCSERVRDDADAARHYRHAIAHAPRLIDGYVRLALLLRDRLDDASGADCVMDARTVKGGLIAANGGSFRAYLERGLYRKRNEIDGFDSDIVRALELAPQSADVLLTAATFAADRGDFEAARRHLTLGQEQHPGNWRISSALASVEKKAGQLDKAEACLRRGVDATADREGRGQLLWLLAELEIDKGDLAEAKAVIEQLGQNAVRPELLKYLDARIRIGELRWIEARRELEAIYPHLGSESALAYQINLLLGLCYEQLGDNDQRDAAFRRAVALDPGRVEGHLGLAATREATGKLDEAASEYRRVIDRVPTVRMALARLLILRNLRRPAAQRDWAEVEKILDQADRAKSDSTGVAVLRAEALVAQGQPGRARDLLKAARDAHPDRIELWIALAELADRHETAESALVILRDAEGRFGHRVALQLGRIQHWASRGGTRAPQGLAQLERDLANWTEGDQELLLRGLADAYLRTGDPGAANRLVGRLVERRPLDLGLRFTQFELALQLGDEAAMKHILDELQAIEAEPQSPEKKAGPLWRCAKARYLLWTMRRGGRGAIQPEMLDEAHVLLSEAGRWRPSWPLIPLCTAEIDDWAGNSDRAIRDYLRAIELGMSNSAIIRRVVQLLYDLRRYEQADRVIRQVQEQGLGSGDAEFQRLAAEVSLRANDPARALNLARQTIPVDSKDYRDHLWLGQLYWAAGEPVKAEPELRRAVDLAGDAPEVWVILVQFLGRTGHQAEARTVIEQARGKLTGDQAAQALARCHAELGDLDEARAQFRKALAARPDDVPTLRGAATLALGIGQIGEAEAYLLKIVDFKDQAPEDAAWARRLLATVLAARGDHRRALALVALEDEGASYIPSSEDPVEELRARAKVLAFRNNRVARRTAIRILQELDQREQLVPDDRYLLARLYEADGDWTQAHRQMRSLLASDDKNPLFLAYVVRALLRRGTTDEARPWFDTLEKLDPSGPATMELKARLLKQGGRAGDAVELLRSFVQARPDQAGPVAMLLEELGQMTAAEDLYREVAVRRDQPRAILALAGFLARRDRAAEAIDLCEKAASMCPPEAVAEATVALLYSAPVEAARCRRAAELLERALEQTSRKAGFLFHLGNIRSLEGRYQEAEQLYRQSLESDPANSGPLANLAWLLARRDGNGRVALDLVARAMKLDGPSPDLLDTRAISYLVLGRSDLAIKDLEDAVAVSPSPLKYVHLAQAHWTAGGRTEARAALRNAQAAGLSPEKLSPLERATCERLLTEVTRD
jgi:tetratricopeptide (TPR) repeat protein